MLCQEEYICYSILQISMKLLTKPVCMPVAINGDLHHLIRKRDWLYDKMRKACSNVSTHAWAASLRTKFHELKSHVHAETRKTYWNYSSTVILPQDGSGTPNKSFWSFVRRNRTEQKKNCQLQDKGPHSEMDRELPGQPYTGSGHRWGEEQARAGHIRSRCLDLDSTVHLFADDTIAYLIIDNQA